LVNSANNSLDPVFTKGDFWIMIKWIPWYPESPLPENNVTNSYVNFIDSTSESIYDKRSKVIETDVKGFH